MTNIVEGFEIVEGIGSGGFSRVHRARQIGFDRDVALKILSVDIKTPAQQAAFERECRAMGSLAHHPSIVSVFTSAFTTDGRPCIVMEYFAGGTLSDAVKADGPLDVAAVLRAGIEVCGALQTAHDHGIVHRDIKPSNLFVSSFGATALGDFGISGFDNEQTVTGIGALTVHYAPPELLESEPASVLSDVYSLAASLYSLAAGTKPFTQGPGQTTADLLRRIVVEPAPKLERDDAPASLVSLLFGAMAKRPSDRPPSAAEFGRRLQSIQAELGHSITPLVADGVEPMTHHASVVLDDQASAQPRQLLANRRVTAAALGVLAVVALGSTAFAMSIRSGESGLSGENEASGGSDANDGALAGGSVTAADSSDDVFFGAPLTPADISVTASDNGALEVSWAADTTGRSLSYEVQRPGAGEPTPAAGTSVVIPDLDGAAACFVVRAVGDSGRLSADSSPVCLGD